MTRQQAFLTVDLGFGDAGKGSIVDCLTRSDGAHTVIRYNGGAQAGHRVVELAADGVTSREHVFAQFGSGTLAGAATHLSHYMLLDPLAMMAEEQHLQSLGISDAFARTTIDAGALVITPFQRAINRLRELARGVGRHGSCGMGIGETMTDFLAHGEQVLFAGDLCNQDHLRAKLAFVRDINLAKLATLPTLDQADEQIAVEMEWLTDPHWADWLMPAYADFSNVAQIVGATYLPTLLQQPGTVIFEGAQGVLLDEWRGFHPYTTWSTTTLTNANRLLTQANYTGKVTRIGITRAYSTRHGAGPFVTEDAQWTAQLPDACNQTGAWQQGFRVGPLDLVLLRYAAEVVGGLDYLAVTCLDRLAALPAYQVCRRYEDHGTRIERIRPVAQAGDLVQQARLTDQLLRCQPRLEEVSSEATLLAAITGATNLPIGIRSSGPTASAKQLW